MNVLVSLIFATAIAAGHWLESDLAMGAGWFWWGGLVAGYLLVCLWQPAQLHRFRLPITGVSGLLLLGVVYFYDATMTIYLSGVILLFVWILTRWLDGSSLGRQRLIGVIVLVSLSLLVLPVPINRITVKLPNLSAGTYLTIYASPEQEPGLDSVFFNRLDDHQELLAGLGTQIWFTQETAAPLLKIDILREKIVVRILSITYETRVAYLDLPLFSVEGEALLQLSDSGLGQPFQHGMEKNRLLIENLAVDKPAWIQLPPMEAHSLSAKDHAVIVLVRLLVWLIVALALLKWTPLSRRRNP